VTPHLAESWFVSIFVPGYCFAVLDGRFDRRTEPVSDFSCFVTPIEKEPSHDNAVKGPKNHLQDYDRLDPRVYLPVLNPY